MNIVIQPDERLQTNTARLSLHSADTCWQIATTSLSNVHIL